VAYAVHSGEQVGYARIGVVVHASLWKGSSASWVSLAPAGATESRAYGVIEGMQVGYADVGGVRRASIWAGAASSWIDLSTVLPSHYTASAANDIAIVDGDIIVIGSAQNSITGQSEAMQWVLREPDSDGDGLLDADGVSLYGTNPNDPDSDDDGLLDGTEVDMAAGGGCPSPLDPDSDNDGLSDGQEVNLGTSTCNPDTDGDGLIDSLDPTPTVPGAPGSWIESLLRQLASEVLNFNLVLIDAPNGNAKSGRRNAMSNRLNDAANLVAVDDFEGAIDEISSLLAQLDGDPTPKDWMVPSSQKDDLANTLRLLIMLMQMY